MIQAEKFVVAVEVEMVVPVDDPGDPCYEAETVQFLRQVKERAESAVTRSRTWAARATALASGARNTRTVPSLPSRRKKESDETLAPMTLVFDETLTPIPGAFYETLPPILATPRGRFGGYEFIVGRLAPQGVLLQSADGFFKEIPGLAPILVASRRPYLILKSDASPQHLKGQTS